MAWRLSFFPRDPQFFDLFNQMADEIRHAQKFDLRTNGGLSVDFGKLVSRISATVDHDSDAIAAGYSKNPNIDYYHDTASFLSNKVLQVGREQLSADKIFIAVGSRPLIPAIPGLKGTPFMTSTEALRRTALPKSMLVIGASYIACELGHAYGAFGCDVHFMVRSKFLRHEDKDIQEEFTRVFSKKYPCHLGCSPQEIRYEHDRFVIFYTDPQGARRSMETEALLVATGVVPNTDTLGLPKTGIKLTKGGFVQVDDKLETSVKGVYALGDCIGRYFYRHSVNFEGEYLFKTVFLDNSREPIRYPPVPHAVFTNPQIAGVGKTEQELAEEGVDYVVGMNPYAKSAMGMARLSEHGFCKILIDAYTTKILGAHIIGDEASDMIHILIALMYKDATLDDLTGMIFIHPALPEIVRNAARKARAELDQRVAAGKQNQKLAW